MIEVEMIQEAASETGFRAEDIINLCIIFTLGSVEDIEEIANWLKAN